MKNLHKLFVASLVISGLFTAPLANAFTYDNSYANKSADARKSRDFRAVTNLTALSLQSVAAAVVNHINSQKPAQGSYTEAYQTNPTGCGFTTTSSYAVKAPASPLLSAVCAVDSYTVSSSGTINAKIYVWGVPNPQSGAYFSAGLRPGSNAQLRADYKVAGSLLSRFKMANASTGLVEPIGRGVEFLADSGGPYKSGTNASPPPIVGSTNAKALSPVVYFTWSGSNGGSKQGKPTVNLSASPTTVSYGGSSTLTWSSSNASSCTLNGSSVTTSGSKSTGALYSSKNYTLSCTGKGGSNSTSASVSVGSPPKPTVTISASPNPVNYKSYTTVSWGSSNTKSCTFGGVGVPTSGSKSEGPITSAQTFTVSCSGAGGSASGSVTVNVNYPKPTVKIYVTPNPSAYGGYPSVVWSSTGATSCSISGIGAVGTSGSKVVGPLTTSQSYSISCKGPGGSASASTTESVASPPKPLLFMKVSPTSLSAPGVVTISYFTRNASSCYLSPGGSVPTGGSFRRRLRKVVSISSTTTFSMKCTGPGGTASKSVTVKVAVSKPTITFTDRASRVSYGGRDYLSWISSNATRCTLNGNGVSLNASNYQTPPLYSKTKYTLSCNGPGGTVSKSLTIFVAAKPKPPTINWFTANKYTVASGGYAYLYWGASNASYCTVNGTRHGVNGPLHVGPLYRTMTYTLVCYGAGGSATKSLSIRVAPSPSVSLSVTPTSVGYGGHATLSWSSSNASSCTINASGVATSGSKSTGALYSNTTFILTCTGAGGAASKSVSVTVGARPKPVINSFTASPSVVRFKGRSTLSWSTSNASSCSINGVGVAINGSKVTGQLGVSMKYTLTCSNSSGSVSKSVSVRVIKTCRIFRGHRICF